MFRLSKTTDYGIVLMASLARETRPRPLADGSSSNDIASTESRTSQNARELAADSDLPVPMVSKILKALARDGLLVSQRGSKGGYSLARKPEDLTVAEMIRALEGPVGLTDCAIGPALCEHETMCAVREPWQLISRVVEQALTDITLADLVRGRPSPAFDAIRAMLEIEGRDSASPASASTHSATHSPTLSSALSSARSSNSTEPADSQGNR